jgi:hypothetical protein
MSTLVNVEVMTESSPQPLVADSYDYERLPADLRDQVMLAQGTVLTKLGGAVERVIDAGNTLRWAKETLPHGEYLPWVQQACGLKPQQASKLIKAAEFSNVAHEQHLKGITDTNTLFLLSADATPEDVRKWFMERCAAGDPPSRKEIQERKRQASSPRQPRPAEAIAVSLIRKGPDELQLLREALTLAERASIISSEDALAELRLRQLPKGSTIYGADADLHRLRDGRWIRLPHSGVANVPAVVVDRSEQQELMESQASNRTDAATLGRIEAAQRLGVTPNSLSNCVCQAKRKGKSARIRGHFVESAGRGMFLVTPILP